MKTLSLLLLGALAPAAHADPCTHVELGARYFDRATNQRAAALLAAHPEYVVYCPPCGNQAPGEPAQARRVSAGDDDAWLQIDGAYAQLEYVYVHTSPHRYENLAALAGCAVSDVVPSLDASDATATGVMITPSDVPVAVAPIEPPAPPPPPPAPAPAAAPPVIVPPPSIVVVPAPAGAPWGWLVGTFGLGVGAAAGLVLVAARRRQRLRTGALPRALGLADRVDRW